jgi:hypothetical protein
VKREAVKSEKRNRAVEQQSSRNFEFFNLTFEILLYAIYFMLNDLFFSPYAISAQAPYPIPIYYMPFLMD